MDSAAGQPGAAHDAGQRPPVVGGDGTLVLELCHIDDEGLVGQDEAAAYPRAMCPLVFNPTCRAGFSAIHRTTSSGCSLVASPPTTPRTAKSAARQCHPGDSKIADVESLEVDGAWGVIGHDTIDDTVGQSLPQKFPVAGRIRWTALDLAIAEVIELARWTGCRVHILHLSSSDALPMIASARRDGVKLTVETCPHYLSFVSEEIPAGATQFKCCPPIREAGNRELLWQGLADGVIDCVVTDHSPCTVDLKRFDIGDFGVAWGGIASLQISLSAVWSEAKPRGYSLNDVVRWMAENPARQVGLHTKGHIALGYAADLAVFAPDEAFIVDVAKLQHKNPVSAYDRRPLAGVVRSTWLAGKRIDLDEDPRGRLLSRGMAYAAG